MRDQEKYWLEQDKIECRTAFLSGALCPQASNFQFFQPRPDKYDKSNPVEPNLVKRILEEADLGPASTGGKFTR